MTPRQGWGYKEKNAPTNGRDVRLLISFETTRQIDDGQASLQRSHTAPLPPLTRRTATRPPDGGDQYSTCRHHTDRPASLLDGSDRRVSVS